MVDLEIALDPRKHPRVLRLGDLRLLVEDARDLHHRSRTGLELPVDVGELLQRLEDELEQIERRDERPDRQGMPSSSFAPAKSTAPVATMPRNSIDGKKTEKIFCV